MGMRLVTRSDFDGLACGALLLEAGIIDHWKFAHPKDLQDGLIPIDSNDCGLIIIQVNLSAISLKENTREKAALHLPVPV